MNNDIDKYSGSNGMITSTWGPPLWHSIHAMTFNYPVNPTSDQKNEYFQFFKSLGNVLPCKHCRDNYKMNTACVENLLCMEIFNSRDSLSRWLYNLHDKININLGKKSNITYEQLRDRHEQFRAKCGKATPQATEKGCTLSYIDKDFKPKCVLSIVPKYENIPTFNLDSSFQGGKRTKSKKKRINKSKKKKNKSRHKRKKSDRRV